MVKCRRFGVLALVCWLGSLGAGPPSLAGIPGWPDEAPGEERREGLFDVAPDVVTPHTPWAKPYALGKVRALFIIPRWAGREVVELAQRLSLEYQVAPVETPAALSSAPEEGGRLAYAVERPSQVRQRLRDKLRQPCDVIVVGNVQAETLPREIWGLIRRKVEQGAGLVVVPGQVEAPMIAYLRSLATPELVPAALSMAIPYHELPAFRRALPDGALPQPPASLYRLGQGRLLLVHYDPSGHGFITPPFSVAERQQVGSAYDYYQSLAVKFLLTAAGKLAPTRIDSFLLSPVVVDRAALHGATARIGICHSEAAPGGRVRLRLREQNDRVLREVEKPLAATVQFSGLGRGRPTGRYFLDAWILNAQNEVLDWASRSLEAFDAQGLRQLNLKGGVVQPGEGISGTVHLKQPLGAREQLILEVHDFFGRVTSRQVVKTEGDGRGKRGRKGETPDARVDFQINSGSVLSLTAWVRAAVQRDGELVEERSASLPVRQPDTGWGWDDFSFLVWSFEDSYLYDLALQRLRKAGMDRLLTGAWQPEDEHVRQAKLVAEVYNAKCFPYAWYVAEGWHFDFDAMRKKFADLGQRLQPYCDTFSLGDECHLHGEGGWQIDGDVVKRDFQRELKGKYPSLEALNAEWNTDFPSWEEVRGITLAEAKEQGQEARWVDHRMHLEGFFAHFFGEARRVTQQNHPNARVGFEGAFQTDSYRAYDWWKLMQNINLMGNYWFTPAEWELVGSFRRPGTYWGFWNGSYVDVFNRWCQGWIAWRCLLHGMNSVWYWVPFPNAGHGIAFGIFYPDLRLNPPAEPFLEAVQEIKGGPGKLLLTSERVSPGVAIHYSQASVHADTLDEGGFQVVGAGCPHRVYLSWLTFAWSLKEIGIQPRFLSYEQIEQGDLSKYKVLILPFSQAVSEKEAQAMAEFVRQGGVLVADVRPAIRDGHGRRRPRGLLDGLFGIERTGDAKPPEPERMELEVQVGGETLKGILPQAQVDPNVRVTTGQALATWQGIPVLIHHRVGQGQTLLLNFAGHYTPGSYGETEVDPVRTTPAGDGYLDLARIIAKLGGIEPELRAFADGERLRGVDLVTYHDGEAAYYGFTPNDYCDFRWVLTMPLSLRLEGESRVNGHWYDVRQGRYLGAGTRFVTTLARGSATLVARLPYRVTGLDVAGPESLTQGQRAEFQISVRTEGNPPGRHVIHCEVEGPEGHPLGHYDANLVAPDGKATFVLPLALNETEGAWVLKARDVATGTSAAQRFQVQVGLEG